MVKYTAYAYDVSMLVMSSAEVVEASQVIERYEVVKINREKSVGLQVGSWKGCSRNL